MFSIEFLPKELKEMDTPTFRIVFAILHDLSHFLDCVLHLLAGGASFLAIFGDHHLCVVEVTVRVICLYISTFRKKRYDPEPTQYTIRRQAVATCTPSLLIIPDKLVNNDSPEVENKRLTRRDW